MNDIERARVIIAKYYPEQAERILSGRYTGRRIDVALAAFAAEQERCALVARDAMVAMDWPPQDGDQQIDEVMAAIRASAPSSHNAQPAIDLARKMDEEDGGYPAPNEQIAESAKDVA